LTPQGKQLTEAVYSDSLLLAKVPTHGELVLGTRGKENWIINFKNGSQKKVPYTQLSDMSNGYMIVSSDDGATGLINAQGDLVIALNERAWLGDPGVGLIAYRDGANQPCGYLDYTGKVVISPRFGECGHFGKKGALAKGVKKENGPDEKYGLIGPDGSWLVQPAYQHIGGASYRGGHMLDNAPGYAFVANDAPTGAMPGAYLYGIMSLDQGREVVAPKYVTIGVVASDRFIFTDNQSSEENARRIIPRRTVGIMDSKGNVLLKPGRFTDIEPDESGHFLLIRDPNNPHKGEADKPYLVGLYDFNGHELIAPQWHKLVVDLQLSIVKAYDADYYPLHHPDSEYGPEILQAVYDLQGKPLFAVKKMPCGADQLQDGAGKPIWPLDITPYCKKASGSSADRNF
jgi:hypothetical protein